MFEVAEGFLGMEGRGKRIEIRTGMGGGDCGFPFQRGESYLVYAYETKEGLLVASICSRTATVERAKGDLEYLRKLPGGGSFGYVFGVVAIGQSVARFDQATRMWTPAGISEATVSLAGPGKSERLVTGEDGAFRFNGCRRP